jgi:RsiW-degrading membrane proteinase PrsW (M82 family)
MKKARDHRPEATADSYRLADSRIGGIVIFFFLELILAWGRALADCGEPEPPDYVLPIILICAILSCSISATYLTSKFWKRLAGNKPPVWVVVTMFITYLLPSAIICILILRAISVLIPGDPHGCCFVSPNYAESLVCCRLAGFLSL